MRRQSAVTKLLSIALMATLLFPANMVLQAAPSGPVQVLYMGDSIVCRGDLNGYSIIAIAKLGQAGIVGGYSRSSEYGPGDKCTIMSYNTEFLPDSVDRFEPAVFHFNPGIDQVTGLCGTRAQHFEKFRYDLTTFIGTFQQHNPNKVFVYGLSTRCDETVLLNGSVQRRDVDVRELNKVAMEVCRELGVPALDLHSPCILNDYGTTDGRHLSVQGGLGIATISAGLVQKILLYGGKAGAPWVQITDPAYTVSPVLGNEVPAGQSLAVTIAAGGTSIARVELYDNDTKVGEDNAAPYQISVPSVSQGAHRLVAHLVDGDGVSFPSPEVRVWGVGAPRTASLPLKINCGFEDSDGYLAAKEWASDRDFGFSGPFTHRADVSRTDAFAKDFGRVNQIAHLSQEGELIYRVRVAEGGVHYVGVTMVSAKGFDKQSCDLIFCGKAVNEGRVAPPSASRGVPVTFTCAVEPVDKIVTIEVRNKGYIPPVSAIIVQKEPIAQTPETGALSPLSQGATVLAGGRQGMQTPPRAARSALQRFSINGRTLAPLSPAVSRARGVYLLNSARVNARVIPDGVVKGMGR